MTKPAPQIKLHRYRVTPDKQAFVRRDSPSPAGQTPYLPSGGKNPLRGRNRRCASLTENTKAQNVPEALYRNGGLEMIAQVQQILLRKGKHYEIRLC
jgi:hypothetical protein